MQGILGAFLTTPKRPIIVEYPEGRWFGCPKPNTLFAPTKAAQVTSLAEIGDGDLVVPITGR